MNGNGKNGKEGTHNWNIESLTPHLSPDEIKSRIPLSGEVFEKVVRSSRRTILDILSGEDKRLLAVVGPCSVHNVDEALEYVRLLAEFSRKPKVRKHLFVVTRLCVQKPRTGIGWRGLWRDPDLNGACDGRKGRLMSRKLMVAALGMGMPVAMEYMEPSVCQNLDDCMSLWWVGARTVGDPEKRGIATGLSTGVGFKNPPDGGIGAAIEALDLCGRRSTFDAMNHAGIESEVRSTGNQWGFLILRGNEQGPNYDEASVAAAVHQLAARGLRTRLVIDASHRNSGKKHEEQRNVLANIAGQIACGNRHIVGFMYESYLDGGCQTIPTDLSDLKPRISVTDGCDNWEDTQKTLLHVCDILRRRKK